jgi:hypothetical protein
MSLLVTVGLLSFIGELVIRSYLVAHERPRYIVREVLKRSLEGSDTDAFGDRVPVHVEAVGR